jgi:FAD/FMN-containing dehydrogenase
MAKTLAFAEDRWHNWHLTVRDVPIAGRFEVMNSGGGSLLEKMAATTGALRALVGRAFAERRRLRAQGSAWSFSEAASVPGGWVLATGHMTLLAPVPGTNIAPGFLGDRDGLILCQTGIKVSELNMWLERRGRSLPTSGASNGQTLAGATATGTHGSAIDQPAMQGLVRAIHLVPAPDRHLWIEPARNTATDGRIAAALGAEMVRDDRLFDAVLVGLGAFGIVHALVIETVPRFLLAAERKRVPISPEVLRAMAGEGLDDPAMPWAGGRPWFFQSVVNRHVEKDHAYLTVGHKVPWEDGHVLDYDLRNKRAIGYNMAVVLANVLEAAPGITPAVTKAVMADQLKPFVKKASWGQSFNFTTPRAGTCGSATAVSVDRVHDVLALFDRALKTVGKAPVAFACRYALGSPGLLSFIRFPQTAIVDIDGIDSNATRAVMAEAIRLLREANVPHAEHWGKFHQMTAASVRDNYGADLEAWTIARADLLDRAGEYVFGSAFLDRLGLTSPTF